MKILYLSMLIVLCIRCTPEAQVNREDRREKRKFERAKKEYIELVKEFPKLIDSTSNTDTIVVTDSIVIRANNYITNTIIDSVIAPCPEETRTKIKNLCTHESLNGGAAQIFRMINGTFILTYSGNDPKLVAATSNTHTEKKVYYPSEKCEEEKRQLEKYYKEKIKQEAIKLLSMGALGMLFIILVLFAIAKWGFK